MNPLSRLRSWWYQPVTDRLDRIEASLVREYSLKVKGYANPVTEAQVRAVNQAFRLSRRQ